MKPGDVVQLKSGGPRMTIRALCGGYALCVWFLPDGVSLIEKNFLVECLKEASPRTAAECMDFREKHAPGKLRGPEEWLKPLMDQAAKDAAAEDKGRALARESTATCEAKEPVVPEDERAGIIQAIRWIGLLGAQELTVSREGFDKIKAAIDSWPNKLRRHGHVPLPEGAIMMDCVVITARDKASTPQRPLFYVSANTSGKAYDVLSSFPNDETALRATFIGPYAGQDAHAHAALLNSRSEST